MPKSSSYWPFDGGNSNTTSWNGGAGARAHENRQSALQLQPLGKADDCELHSLLSSRDEALEFLKPVLHQHHLGDGLGLSLFELEHEELRCCQETEAS